MVSNPNESGVTSSKRISLTSPASTPAWIAAPTATTSSGLTFWLGRLLIKLRTNSCTAGIRVEPPTRTTSSISSAIKLASLIARFTGPRSRAIRSLHSSSNWARVSRVSMCLGPSAVAVMKGRLISVTITPESSILAFSAASVRRWRDWRSLRRSIFSAARNCSANQSTILRSKSIPPNWTSPLVDLTWKTPSPTSSTDTSKVPPPRSKAKIVSLWRLSNP